MAISRHRRRIFVLVAAVLVLAAVEGIGWLAWWRLEGRPYSWAQGAGAAARAVALGAGGAETTANRPEELPEYLFWMRDEILHPFLGYVQDPGRAPGAPFGSTDPWGFFAPSRRPPPGEDTEIILAVTGGSVATFFAVTAGEELARLLEAAPAFAGRRVVVENWASPGYKQPQQLFTLSWFLALGRRPDVVINLDGFNDLVLGWAENARHGVYPFYPRSWHWRVRQVPEGATQEAIGRVAWARQRRAAAAGAFAASPLVRSALGSFLWRARDRRLAAALAAAEEALRQAAEDETASHDYLAQGPPLRSRELPPYLDEAAELWRRSSEQMAALCASAGIPYFHFLQPNQYAPESKPMGREERLRAIGYPWAERIVPRGYALLREQGAELRARGVRFHDLHRAFAGVAEPLYIDACCHFDDRGNQILARAVAAAVAGELQAVELRPR
jgi:hypothetical protein